MSNLCLFLSKVCMLLNCGLKVVRMKKISILVKDIFTVYWKASPFGTFAKTCILLKRKTNHGNSLHTEITHYRPERPTRNSNSVSNPRSTNIPDAYCYQSSSVTYGGADGPYYAAHLSRRSGPDGVRYPPPSPMMWETRMKAMRVNYYYR